MESAKDATNAVKNTVYTIAKMGDEKLFSAEEQTQQKAADQELEKEENVKTATGAPNAAEGNDTKPMEQAKGLMDNLSKLGTAQGTSNVLSSS